MSTKTYIPICFIDYNKAFDKVRHKQLMNVLKTKQMAIMTLDLYQIYIINNEQKYALMIISQNKSRLNEE